jgi:hypothetical protein
MPTCLQLAAQALRGRPHTLHRKWLHPFETCARACSGHGQGELEGCPQARPIRHREGTAPSTATRVDPTLTAVLPPPTSLATAGRWSAPPIVRRHTWSACLEAGCTTDYLPQHCSWYTYLPCLRISRVELMVTLVLPSATRDVRPNDGSAVDKIFLPLSGSGRYSSPPRSFGQ